MSALDLCPRCKQPLPAAMRGGVYLSPKKAAIFDTIKNHPGITIEGIIANLDDGSSSRANIRVHINQINDLLAGTDLKIKAEIRGGHRREPGVYRIIKRHVKEVA